MKWTTSDVLPRKTSRVNWLITLWRIIELHLKNVVVDDSLVSLATVFWAVTQRSPQKKRLLTSELHSFLIVLAVCLRSFEQTNHVKMGLTDLRDSRCVSSVAVYLVEQRSNVLAAFISLSGSNMRPCFAFARRNTRAMIKKRSLIGRFGFGAKGFLKMEPCLFWVERCVTAQKTAARETNDSRAFQDFETCFFGKWS